METPNSWHVLSLINNISICKYCYDYSNIFIVVSFVFFVRQYFSFVVFSCISLRFVPFFCNRRARNL